jgi:hypothetical protein
MNQSYRAPTSADPEVAPTAPTPELAPSYEPFTPAEEPAAPSLLDAAAQEVGRPRKDGRGGAPWEALSPEQQRMVDELRPGEGPAFWSGLDPKRRQGFLNVTAALVANGFALEGLQLQQGGIHQDRLLFTPESAELLRGPLQDAITNADERGDTGFVNDKPEDELHPGMGEWGGRQAVTTMSMQVGGGKGGAFVDIDEFRPGGDLAGTMGHAFEVLRNGLFHRKTDPFTVAKGLKKRGLDP